MHLKIITIPKYEKNLRQKSQAVDLVKIQSTEMQNFFDALSKKMFKADGLGLAAPQVNYPVRVFAVSITQNESKIFINPHIIKKSFLKETGEEGCLSIPNIYGQVKRHQSITIKYFDRQGKEKKERYSGLLARIIQHENDHLNGILFTDRLQTSN